MDDRAFTERRPGSVIPRWHSGQPERRGLTMAEAGRLARYLTARTRRRGNPHLVAESAAETVFAELVYPFLGQIFSAADLTALSLLVCSEAARLRRAERRQARAVLWWAEERRRRGERTHVEAVDDAEAVQFLLNRANGRSRAALEYLYLDGRTERGLAAENGLTRGQVHNQKRTAIRAARKATKKFVG